MKLNSLFDGIYYINLDFRKDRNEKFWYLNKKFLCEERTIRISAYDASNPGLKKNQLDWQKIIAARAAHATSYSSVFKNALSRGYKNILVFEDDAEPMYKEVSTFFKIFDSALTNNYEMLFLGGTIQSKLLKLNEYLYSINGNVLTTHAICFNNRNNLFEKIASIAPNFETAIKNISEKNIATDMLTAYLSTIHKSFFPCDILYGQYESFSDTDGKKANYNNAMFQRFEKYK